MEFFSPLQLVPPQTNKEDVKVSFHSMPFDDIVCDIVVPNAADVLTVEFSTDSSTMVAGTGDSTVLQLLVDRQFKVSSSVFSSAMSAGEDFKAPPVCIRFAPEARIHQHAGAQERAKNLMLVATADGNLSQWHLSSARRLQSVKFEENPIYALDFAPLGSNYVAAGGSDGLVRILDTNRLGNVVEHLKMSTDVDWVVPGSLRVQSLKHVDPNIIVSGGWSRTVHVWDRRVGMCVSHIVGPYLCGDGLDVTGVTMVTASYREENALQMWDLRKLDEPSCKCLQLNRTGAVPIPSASAEGGDAEPQRPSLFTAKFSPSGSRFLVGGSFGQLHMFDTLTCEEILGTRGGARGVAGAALLTEAHTVFSVAWSSDGRHAGAGGGSGLCVGFVV